MKSYNMKLYDNRPREEIYEFDSTIISNVSLMYDRKGSYSYMSNEVQFYLDDLNDFKDFLSNLLKIHSVTEITVEYSVNYNNPFEVYPEEYLHSNLTFYSDSNCTKPVELLYDSDVDYDGFLFTYFSKTIEFKS